MQKYYSIMNDKCYIKSQRISFIHFILSSFQPLLVDFLQYSLCAVLKIVLDWRNFLDFTCNCFQDLFIQNFLVNISVLFADE